MKPVEPKNLYDVVIVGAGTAGFSAAMYSARYLLKTAVVSKDWGGLGLWAHKVDNYLGLPDITGPELMARFKAHAEKMGAKFLLGEVERLEKEKIEGNGDLLVLHLKDGTHIHGRALILAQGTRRRKLNVPGEDEFAGKGVSYCATCLPTGELIVGNSNVYSIEKVQSGHRVLTVDGSYQPVTRPMERNHEGTLVTVRTRFFTELVSLTAEHPVLRMTVAKGTGPNYWKNFSFSKPTWVPAGDLQTNDILLYPIPTEVKDRPSISISEFVDAHRAGDGTLFYQRPSPTAVRLPERVPVNERFARLIGYYLAEGTITNRGINFYFGSKEQSYVTEVVKSIKDIFGLKSYVKLDGTVRRVEVYSAILRDFFASQFGKYSYHKHLPHWAMVLPAKKQAEIVKGFYRGDGGMRRQDFTLVTNSEMLAYQMRDLLLRLAVLPHVERRHLSSLRTSSITGRAIHFRHDKFEIRVGGPYLASMGEILGLRHPLLKNRSRAHYHGWLRDGYALLPVRRVGRIRYRGKVHNLAVATNNTYVTKNFIVHNCDGPFFKGKTVAVVGGGDAAGTAAILLAQYCPKVYLIARTENKERLRMEPVTVQKLEKSSKIILILGNQVKEILGEETVKKIGLARPYQGSNEIAVEGIFVEIGGIPNSELAETLGIALDEHGHIKVSEWMATNVPGVFAAGDVTEAMFKFDQFITAAAEGSLAATGAYQYLKGLPIPSWNVAEHVHVEPTAKPR